MNDSLNTLECTGGFSGPLPRCLACSEFNNCESPLTIGMDQDPLDQDHFSMGMEKAYLLANTINDHNSAITGKLEQHPEWIGGVVDAFGSFTAELEDAADAGVSRYEMPDDSNPGLTHLLPVNPAIDGFRMAMPVLEGMQEAV